jgi:uncharacterized protein YwqG
MSSQQQLRKLVEALVRPCTVAVPSASDAPLPQSSTKFGGMPYAERGDAWPMCGCGRGLTFVFQWNAADAPHPRAGAGLYAFFYCHECGSWGDLPADVKDAWAIRQYAAPDESRSVALEDRSPTEHRHTECSCTLSKAPSLPDWDGLGELSDEAAELSAELKEDEPWEPYSEIAEEILGGEPDYRTQVGGYPRFVQGADFPECECGQRMSLLAQIDSEDEAVVMWGDSGCVYLFTCDKHPKQIQMRLQCF